MSLYDDASLVMIPSGYKTSKVYSAKPTDGSGDLTFTRTGDTATRVSSDGLIQKVRTNELIYSQDFTQTAWTNLSTATLSSTTTVTPAGTTDAVRVTATAAVQDLRTLRTITNGLPYTNSAYIRRVSGTGIINILDVNGSTSNIAVTNEWQRFSITATATSTTGRLYIRIQTSGDVIEVWGCQMELSDFGPTAYIETTSAAVSVGPVANLPRIDYTGGGCGKLLLEPQRTNLVTYSEQFDNAAWVKTRVSVTANDATSPDGYTNADKMVSTDPSESYIQSSGISSLASGVFSFFAKKGSLDFCHSLVWDITGSGRRQWFNIATGEVGTTTAFGSGYDKVAAGMDDYGNGWYRCWFAWNNGVSVSAVRLNLSGADGSINSPTNSFGYFYGAQVESAVSYPSSLIPTLSAAVTRGADAAYKTGISSLIGQTEGTLFVECEYERTSIVTGARKLASLNDGSSANLVDIYVPSGLNTLQARLRANSAGFGIINTSSVPTGRVKIAYAYKANDYALYINGTQIGTVTTGGAFTFTSPAASFQIGDGEASGDELGGTVAQTLLFKTRFTNAQLAELTTL